MEIVEGSTVFTHYSLQRVEEFKPAARVSHSSVHLEKFRGGIHFLNLIETMLTV